MVLVPPGKQGEADKLAKICNDQSTEPVCEGQYNLLFHHVPQGGEGEAEVQPKGEAQRLKTCHPPSANAQPLSCSMTVSGKRISTDVESY